jgi:DNA-binding transcriptional LysR family regulator
MYDLRQLRHFVALVEHGSFARAADSVHLSQPALSRSIQALEANLDCRLINRHARSISLTAQGDTLHAHALRVLAASKSMEQAVRQVDNLEAGEIRIGAGPFPAASLVPRALARLLDGYPKLRVEVLVESWEGLRQRLLDEDIELFVADIRELRDDPQLNVEPLPVHGVVAVCRPGHPLSGQDDVTFKCIAAFPLAGTHLPEAVERGFREDLGRDRALSVLCDNFTLLITLVELSDAVCMAPRDVVADGLEPGRLIELKSLSAKIRHHSAYGLVSRHGRQLSPAAQALRDRIR